MRFKDVLTYDKDTLHVSFSFAKLCKMRNFWSEDVSHIGKVIKYCVLGANGMVNYKIPFVDAHLLVDKKTGKSNVVKYDVDDFTIGMFVVVPATIVTSAIMYKMPFKMYLVLGILGFVVLNQK